MKKKGIARSVQVAIQVCWVDAILRYRVALFNLINAMYVRMAIHEFKENV